MNAQEVLSNKSIKSKDQVSLLAKELIAGKIFIKDIILFYETLKDRDKATCLESIEYATREKPHLATKALFNFAVSCLKEKAPRIKWESAKIIGNIAHVLPVDLKAAIDHLQDNVQHEGTVVRWATAYALSQIVKLPTKWQKELIPKLNSIAEREKKGSIKKIYMNTLEELK